MSEEVAFDLRSAEGSPTGVGRYLLSIVQALAQNRPDLPLRAYVRDQVAGLPANVHVVRNRYSGPLWHARTWWHLRRHPVRAYCSTSLIIPALTGAPCLPIVLDLISFLYPQYQMRRTRLFERVFMPRAIRRHPIIVGTETTRGDVERRFGQVRSVVVPPWTSARTAGAHDRSALDRLDVRPPYVLYIGTVEPRKNVLVAARAVAELRSRGRDLRLVLVGGRGWIGAEVARKIDEAEAEGTVRSMGYLSDGDRDALLGSATCLVLPSVYEGFGMPLLEAMATGIPCVTSNAPVFEEVAGDAALHLPDDFHVWSASLERLLLDDGLRHRLSVAGLERSSAYSSGRTSEAFVEALAQLA